MNKVAPEHLFFKCDGTVIDSGARGKLLDLDSVKEQDSKNEKEETEYREDKEATGEDR